MLIGRDAERAAIGALLEAVRASRSSTLVVRGEPGMGKTALLEDAREQASDMRVLSARGVESESDLPFAALHQLIRPALPLLEALPRPQADALRGALGLSERAGDDRFLISAACLTLLSELAEQGPVLCLVDDAHWLDTASADALLFVARRLDAEGIVLLFAAREGDVRGFETANVPSLLLEGLDSDAAATLLSRAAGEAAPSVRERLIEQARGNALALVELPSALSEAQLAGDEPLPEALPLTRQVESIFLERVRRLPDDAQRLLLLAAADDAEDAGLVTRASELVGAGPRTLDIAEQAGLISVNGNRLEFRHPLVRSAVYEAATSSERRAAHRALAEALARHEEQSDRRAWHLAASVLEPDESVVRALEEAAQRATERAGYLAAAKALARAAALSADAEARGRRLVEAARCARIAGADDDAVALANKARPLVGDPLLRGEIAYAIGIAEFRRGRPLEALQILLEAVREVSALDPHKAIELLIWAMGAASFGGDSAANAEVSRLVAAVVPAEGDDESVFVAQALAAFARAWDDDTAAGAEHLEGAFGWASTADDAQSVFAVSAAALVLGDQRRFASLINRAISLARARGEFGTLAPALTLRAAHLMLAQRFDEAALEAGEGVQFARELGAVNLALRPLSILAHVAAIRGDDEETRRLVDEVLELAIPRGLQLYATSAIHTLALLDLGRGRWTEALDRLGGLAGSRPNVPDTIQGRLALPDTVEAAVRAGRLDEARQALSTLEDWVADSGTSWASSRLAGCHALLAEGEEATEYFEKALRLASDSRPFDLARIQLLYGEHLRRDRHRADSRAQLRAALEGFERLRAEPWTERARGELRASGETARRRDPSTIDQLTPQELQIARFVAEGLSNKEVAAQLFLSPRTIHYHLRRVFVKLDITSRTQLARLVLSEGEPMSATSLRTPART
jgi:DNA-binding CsgD family transcriptional regulator